MTKVALHPGQAIRQQRNLIHAVGWCLPQYLTDGAASASSSRPATSATGGIAHTVGAWVEVVPSLSADVGFVKITPNATIGSNGVDTSTLVNLGVGAAAAEVAVLENLGVGYFGHATIGPNQHPGWIFPLFIAKGSRVSLQCQGAVINQAVSMRVEFYGLLQGIKPASKIVTIGANTATSKGVNLATPGGANAEGAWTEITATTTEPFAALGVAIQGGGDIAQANSTGLVDIGMGASGSEVELIPDLAAVITTAETIAVSSPLVHACRLPRGTRLVARNALSVTTSTLDVILYGVRPAI